MSHAPLQTAEPRPSQMEGRPSLEGLGEALRMVRRPLGLAGGVHVPACPPEQLGDPAFGAAHGVRYAYYAGAMANGIASVELVEALGRAGFLAFYGAAGLPIPVVEHALQRLQNSLGTTPFGVNLIHSPNEPALESGAVELFLRRGLQLIEASAFLDLTLPLVRYRTAGIQEGANGTVVTPNRIVAKVSRVEVATKFLSPPPPGMLEILVSQGHLTPAQALLAGRIPMAEDLTAEADSGGHTDNRPAIAMLPSMLALRDRLQRQYGFAQAPRVGLAGGISTPAAAAAAFAMGAAYIVTGSVNQACVESGSSDAVRQMLAEAEQADVTMAPAADMFEMGVNLQVLKRGTMFSMRARQLYQLYRTHASIESLPSEERSRLEKTIFRDSLDTIWAQTKSFFLQRDPEQVARAEQDPKHKMALVFRWYLGMASRWANQGVADRKIDYQVWCGPAMGAFNEWVKGSFLEQAGERRAVLVGQNILYGAAVLTRCHFLRCQGIQVPAEALQVAPLHEHELKEFLQ